LRQSGQTSRQRDVRRKNVADQTANGAGLAASIKHERHRGEGRMVGGGGAETVVRGRRRTVEERLKADAVLETAFCLLLTALLTKQAACLPSAAPPTV